MKAYRVEVYGRIQAVGFRRAAQQLARQFGLAGNISNEPDGSVHITVQGEETKIESFLGSIRLLSEPIKIDSIEKTEIPTDTKIKSFVVIYGDAGQEIEEGLGAGLEQLILLRKGLDDFSSKTNTNFETLSKRYDAISETLAKVVEQSAESSNELKKSMETLVKSLDSLTGLARTYFEERLKSTD